LNVSRLVEGRRKKRKKEFLIKEKTGNGRSALAGVLRGSYKGRERGVPARRKRSKIVEKKATDPSFVIGGEENKTTRSEECKRDQKVSKEEKNKENDF